MSRLLLKPGAFRLLLAGMVLLSHLSAISTGGLGVVLFFLLSGYWISDLWERQSKDTAGKQLFFLNRFLRIWPIYMIVVIASCYFLARPIHLSNISILGVASSAGVRPLGVEWSLDIEVQFYLLLPLIALLRPSWWLLLPAIIAGWVVWLYLGIYNVFMYLPAFGAGILCYRRRHQPIAIPWWLSAAGFALLTALLASTAAGRSMLNTKLPDIMNPDVFVMLWGMPLVFYIAHSLRLRSGAFDRHLGNLSYPLYLVHEPIIQFMRLHGVTSKLLIVATACVVAVAVYVLLDRWIENQRYALLARMRLYLADRRRDTSGNPGVDMARDYRLHPESDITVA